MTRVQVKDWLRDGSLLVEIATADDEGDIGLLPADGSAAWRPVVKTPAVERHGAVFPDGRWLAYMSNETGDGQVYVQPLAGPGSRLQVPGPGWAAVWSQDGAELLYLRGGPPPR